MLKCRITAIRWRKATNVKDILERNAVADTDQGCQMVYLHTNNHNLGIFLKGLELNMLVYFTVIWYSYDL
jgi:hypothetical protein